MSSGAYLTIKSHLSEFKSGSDRDTLSEASESGTSASATSAEDLQKLALILGLPSAEDVYQERFRVDRRRLEAMLSENLEESQTANSFFHRVMNDTNTLINWPARLKIGARSKKDPHVRVAGRTDDVKLAREKIMQLLDTRSNRVTMKLDVSYTDHSHIIGKGGLTIKRVMEETGCHIHFPDSNRSNAVEKSNQVSIAGDMERVERARARVRALTPLIFCFELPIMGACQPLPDVNSPYVQQVQEQYHVQVMLRTRPKLHATLVVVKGVQWEVQATMEATTLLINYMCGSVANQTLVQMSLEISPMHHSVVLGRGAAQLKVIMKSTNTQIMFPDAEDPNIPTLRKSNVTITGNIKDVYTARQQLVGSLPLVVIFDVVEEGTGLEADAVARVMAARGVLITVRRKPKQGLASIVIKGIERGAGDIYEARRELLGGKEPLIPAEVPESYNIPAMAANSIPNFGVFNPFSPSHQPVPQSPCAPHVGSLAYGLPPLQLAELAGYAGLGSPLYHAHNPPTPGGYPSPMSPGGPVFPQAWTVVPPSPQRQPNPFPYPSVPTANPMSAPYANQNQANASPWNSNVACAAAGPRGQQYHQGPAHHAQQPSSLNQLLNISSQASSGYQSNFTGSSVSLDTHNVSGGDSSNVVSPSVSPISKSHSPSHSADTDRSQDMVMMSELSIADRRAVGCEKKTLENMQAKLSPMANYHKMKTEATKAMQESVGSASRVPTPRWAGYYFSHTSPGQLNLNEANNSPDKCWNRSEPLVRPNITEVSSPRTPPTPAASRPCRYKQLYALLADVGLHKYVDLFQQHEIDISTFASLSEADLVEIGVAAFGARRKMLLIIAELKKQQCGFKGSAAPGAERKLINSPPQYNTAALRAQDKW